MLNAISNSAAREADRKALMADVRDLGRDQAAGRDARMFLGLKVVRAAFDGIIDENDVPAIYEAYVAADSKKSVHNHTSEGKKAQVSKMTQLVKAAMIPGRDFVATADDLIDVRNELKAQEVKLKAAYDSLVDAARLQNNKPQVDLTRDELVAIASKPEKGEDTLLDKLVRQYKGTRKLAEAAADEGGLTPSLEAAVHALADAIKEAGGEVPAVTADEKKEAKAVAFLSSRGRI